MEFNNLKPFTSISNKINLQAGISRKEKTFFIEFILSGVDRGKVLLNKSGQDILNKKKQRKDNLWKSTCFEIFLQPKNQKKYWEINASANGNWNVYSFLDYREGMKTEEKIQNLEIKTIQTEEYFKLQFTLDESLLIGEPCTWNVGISTVISIENGAQEENTYWALVHPGEKPDFHLQESFVVGV